MCSRMREIGVQLSTAGWSDAGLAELKYRLPQSTLMEGFVLHLMTLTLCVTVRALVVSNAIVVVGVTLYVCLFIHILFSAGQHEGHLICRKSALVTAKGVPRETFVGPGITSCMQGK